MWLSGETVYVCAIKKEFIEIEKAVGNRAQGKRESRNNLFWIFASVFLCAVCDENVFVRRLCYFMDSIGAVGCGHNISG